MLTKTEKKEIRALAAHAYFDDLAAGVPRDLDWEEEAREYEAKAAACRVQIRDPWMTLKILACGGVLGKRAHGIARDQLNRIGCSSPLWLTGYGPDWKQMPQVLVKR